jgi:hypothetical protein
VIEHLAHTATGVATLLSRGLRKLERDGLRPATDEAPVLPTIDAARLLDRAQRVQALYDVQLGLRAMTRAVGAPVKLEVAPVAPPPEQVQPR